MIRRLTLLLFAIGICTFLIAKGKHTDEISVIHAPRGHIVVDSHSPLQGRLTLLEVSDLVVQGDQQLDLRPFLIDLERREATLIFQYDKEETKLSLVVSQPYYNLPQNTLTFDIVATDSLTSYHQISDITLTLKN